ncbi:MAG: LD-carboxypeptidase [Balneolaceae bacterium]
MKRSNFLKTVASAALPGFAYSFTRPGHATLTRPKRLKEGDRIGLVAPAGIIYDDEEFDRMQEALGSMGLIPVMGRNVKKRYGYLAGTDRERAGDINIMFADAKIDGIMAVRGGWGCARILPYLNFKMIARNPKVYCGFSDNTTLHHAFMAYCGLQTFHGPNGNSEWTDLTRSSFQSVIMQGENAEYRSVSKVETLYPGKAEGRLVGGNLSILTTTLGTNYQANYSGAILFVEDIGENSYKIDRMLTHLKQAGVLDNIKGFIFGRCTDCSSGSSPTFSLRETLENHICPLKIPAVMGMDIGHDDDNFTIPSGGYAVIDADETNLRLSESAVV